MEGLGVHVLDGHRNVAGAGEECWCSSVRTVKEVEKDILNILLRANLEKAPMYVFTNFLDISFLQTVVL